MAYSFSQLQDILRQVGFPETVIPTMAAIAYAESGGNPNRRNPVPPDDSYGLWQINMLGALGPQRRAQFGIASNSDLFDPITNARAALKVYNQQGLRAWSTYTNGAYRKYIAISRAAYSGTASDITMPDAGGNDGGINTGVSDSTGETGTDDFSGNTKLLVLAGAGLALTWFLFLR